MHLDWSINVTNLLVIVTMSAAVIRSLIQLEHRITHLETQVEALWGRFIRERRTAPLEP